MKLLELSVQELPKRGGWPDGVKAIEQNFRGRFFNSSCRRERFLFNATPFELADDWRDTVITRKQYEAALAASQKVEWDGEDLPPVGCECERSWAGDKWLQCKVLFVSNEHVVVKLATREAAYQLSEVKFRPIRSEADKKREEVINEIASLIGRGTFFEDATRIYDAIASGEIKLSD